MALGTQTLEQFSKEFLKDIPGDKCIHWMTTWNMAMMEDKKLWKVLKLALPFEVIANEKYYGNPKKYKKMYEWLNKNTTGYWTHSQILFVFEKEEDAFAFKIRWS